MHRVLTLELLKSLSESAIMSTSESRPSDFHLFLFRR